MMTDTATTAEHIRETQEYITPYALTIKPALIGLPLASPLKRLVAITIDTGLVLLLSQLAGGWIAFILVVGYLRLRKGGRYHLDLLPHASRARVIAVLKPLFKLAIALLVLLLGVTLLVLGRYGGQLLEAGRSVVFHEIDLTAEVRPGEALGVNGFLFTVEKSLPRSDCQTLECWQRELFYLAVALPKMGISKPSAVRLYEIYAAQTSLDADNQARLATYLTEHYGARAEDDPKAIPASVETAAAVAFSPVNWAIGVLRDLGLGVSWSVLYFSLFTCLGGGRTPGKRLLGLRVIKLDATAISFWDSFFRYGGYAAGITTGLLGYIQIYWDANRQAIQDKISATVVVDDRRAAMDETLAASLGIQLPAAHGRI